jgi:hypothetical protein
MQKNTFKKIAIIAGNHLIDSNCKITFDSSALAHASMYKQTYCGNTQCDIIHAIDHKLKILEMCSKVPKNILVPYDMLLSNIQAQIQKNEFIIFESSLRNKSKRNKQKTCSILGRGAYRDIKETKVCSCWGLCVLTVLALLDKSYDKVIFITSPDSLQLKVSDAIKMQQFFQNHVEYKDRFELIWAK